MTISFGQVTFGLEVKKDFTFHSQANIRSNVGTAGEGWPPAVSQENADQRGLSGRRADPFRVIRLKQRSSAFGFNRRQIPQIVLRVNNSFDSTPPPVPPWPFGPHTPPQRGNARSSMQLRQTCVGKKNRASVATWTCCCLFHRWTL